MGTGFPYVAFLLAEDLQNLTQYHVEYHHEYEANGKPDGRQVAVYSLRGFGDQFLYDHVEHGTGSEGQHIG